MVVAGEGWGGEAQEAAGKLLHPSKDSQSGKQQLLAEREGRILLKIGRLLENLDTNN